MTKYVIVGDGGAGTTAAYYIRQADPTGQIEIYSDDPNAAYYRAALTNYLIGELREVQLFATPPDFYETHDIQRSSGRVNSLDEKNSRFTLNDGRQVAYDKLLIAAGASPNPPNFRGAELPGVMTMRTLQDARRVMDLVSSKQLRQAVIVGGGPLGIEWVQGLLHHHVRVIYLLRGDMFFEKALDRTASDLVISRLRAAGVDVRTNEEIGEALPGRDGRVRAIRLRNSNNEIECQLVGAAIGIRPNVEFLNGSGVDLAVDEKRGITQGIKVDETLRTNIPNIFAAGDIIYRTLGLWEPARLQGRVAGRNMAGGSEVFRDRVHYKATRLYDLDFAGAGETVEKPGDEVVVDFPRGGGRVAYRKLIIREGKLVGAIMLGQRKENVRKYGMYYRDLIEKKLDVSSVSKNLLDPSFDLASWMDSYEISDQIDSARRIPEARKMPPGAAMRQTLHQLNMKPTRTSAEGPSIKDAILLQAGTKIPVRKMTQIGRKPENDLVLNDPDVSGKHARVRWDQSAFFLEDMQSRNGTFLNGIRISVPTLLSSGALIKVGSTQIQFFIGSPTENLRMTSAGLPEAPLAPAALPSDPVWGFLQVGGREIELRMSSPNIGRDAKADITLDDPTLSYIHAQLVRQGEDVYVRDLGSRNGTQVNGKLAAMPCRLESGDVIKLGDTSLVFRSGSAPALVRDFTAPAVARPESVVPVPESPAPPAVPLSAAPIVESSLPKKLSGLSLIMLTGESPGRLIPLNRSSMTVGRDPLSHVIISDETVSWNHAILKQEDMQWFVRDINSSNGTRVNDQRLTPDQLYPLQAGDKLGFGEMFLEVTQDAD